MSGTSGPLFGSDAQPQPQPQPQSTRYPGLFSWDGVLFGSDAQLPPKPKPQTTSDLDFFFRDSQLFRNNPLLYRRQQLQPPPQPELFSWNGRLLFRSDAQFQPKPKPQTTSDHDLFSFCWNGRLLFRSDAQLEPKPKPQMTIDRELFFGDSQLFGNSPLRYRRRKRQKTRHRDQLFGNEIQPQHQPPPDNASETADTDGDGVGDNADASPEDASEGTDADGDGNADAFPEDESEPADTDGDGVGDTDADGDGVGDNSDEDASEGTDADGDGVGDNDDAFPEDASETADTDGEDQEDDEGTEAAAASGQATTSESASPLGVKRFLEPSIDQKRSLLSIYTLGDTAEAICESPKYWLKGSEEKDVCRAFDKFPSDAFLIDERMKITLNPDSEAVRSGKLRESEKIIGPELERVTKQTRAMLAKQKELRTRRNRAELEKRGLKRNEGSDQDRALRKVYNCLHSRTHKELSSDGGDTNAELTYESIEAICAKLKAMGIDRTKTVVDLGCSFNKFAGHVAQRIGCKTAGVEYVTTRAYLCATGMINMLQDVEARHQHWFNSDIAFLYSNIFNLTNLNGFHCLYMFDEAFPMPLMSFIIKLAYLSPSIEVIITFKASKRRKVHELFKSHFFDLHDKQVVTKIGGEMNHAYFWKRSNKRRQPALYESDGIPEKPPSGYTVTNVEYVKLYGYYPKVNMEDHMRMMWDSVLDDKISVYQDLFKKCDNEMDIAKKSRAQTVNCGAHVHSHCGPSCPTCTAYFDHMPPSAVTVQRSRISKMAIFAAEDMADSLFITEYKGGLLKKAQLSDLSMSDLEFVFHVEGNLYVNAKGGYAVNHSSDANCELVLWRDHDNNKRVSLQSIQFIKAGEELTIEHQHCDRVRCCLCPLCVEPKCVRKPSYAVGTFESHNIGRRALRR